MLYGEDAIEFNRLFPGASAWRIERELVRELIELRALKEPSRQRLERRAELEALDHLTAQAEVLEGRRHA